MSSPSGAMTGSRIREVGGLAVVEAVTRPRVPREGSLDRLYMGESFFAVLDGATPKGGVNFEEMKAFMRGVLRLVRLAELNTWSLGEFIAHSSSLRHVMPEKEVWKASRPCVTLAAVSTDRAEIWRVGDVWVSIDGVSMEPQRQAELGVARTRSEILKKYLMEGYSVDELRQRDLGREQITEDLISLYALQNSTTPIGFGVINGDSIAPQFQEVWPIEESVSQIVLATDGYLSAASTLDSAENELATRIGRDPLMIEEPPSTKGAPPGCLSFDDRTYLRIGLSD